MDITVNVKVSGEIRLPDLAALVQPKAVVQIPEAVNVAPAPIETPEAPKTVPAPATAPAYSLDEIARAGAELAQQGPGMVEKLTGLLEMYNIRSVRELPAEQTAAFGEALKRLGAKL